MLQAGKAWSTLYVFRIEMLIRHAVDGNLYLEIISQLN